MSLFFSKLQQVLRRLNHYDEFLYRLSLDGTNVNKDVSIDDMREAWYSIVSKLQQIQGWVSDTAGMGLYQIARFGNHNGVIVELGSWKGRSTVWLASGIKDRGNGHVFSIDTWKGSSTEPLHKKLLTGYKDNQLYEEFVNNLKFANIDKYVTSIVAETSEAVKNWDCSKEIGLLFIDASHEYEGVKTDFIEWSRYVQQGGYIVFDDVPSWDGPTRVVNELTDEYKFIGTFTNQFIVQRIK